MLYTVPTTNPGVYSVRKYMECGIFNMDCLKKVPAHLIHGGGVLWFEKLPVVSEVNAGCHSYMSYK